jgi:hypothetical protein
MDMRLKHESFIQNKVIRKYPFERGVQVFQPDLGQKTESAHIDTQDGNASFPGESRSSEHRPVAAQNKKYVRFVRQLSFLIASLSTEKNRRRRVQNHIDASSPKPADHIVQRPLDLRKLWLCQNPDTLAFH